MKKSILFFIMLLAVALTGCKNYDEDIDKINARLAALETWEANVNINITALQTAVTALQGKDYVTKVVALSDGYGLSDYLPEQRHHHPQEWHGR
jgi:outer membrane lipoprotein-sorting protein